MKINGYRILKSVIHPNTKEKYSIGDYICIYQGRFGHNNLIKIGSLFEYDGMKYVSEKEYTEQDFGKKQHWTSAPQGTYIESIKEKLTIKRFNQLKKDLQKYS